MEFVDLKKKNEKDLHELLSEKRDELRELRFKVSEGQLKDNRLIRRTRKMVAQILTLLNQKRKKPQESVKKDEN